MDPRSQSTTPSEASDVGNGISAARSRNAIVYNPQSPQSSDPALVMQAFLRRLSQRYQAVCERSNTKDSETPTAYAGLIESLGLADAAFERQRLGLQAREAPLQIGFFGPTQAGKSTVVNWISGQPLAQPSPLAGFTVHPQGFSDTRFSACCESLDRYFAPSTRCRQADLDPSHLDLFSLEMGAQAVIEEVPRGTVLWDSPDFDSARSGLYREHVIRLAGLVDVIVLVVSKDKYGDLAVWEFLKLIEPLGQPTLLVINKTDPASSALIVQSVRDKWAAHRSSGMIACVTLPYLPGADGHAASSLRGPLVEALTALLPQVNRQRDPASALVDCCWDRWVQPVIAEHRLDDLWEQRIDEVLKDCLERYQRDYLNHPHHYETFQRALAELLTLLEVPGLGTALHAARQLVTWPVRQLSRLSQGDNQASGRDQIEWQVLHQLAQHAWVTLSEQLFAQPVEDPREERWWLAIRKSLAAQKIQLLEQFDHRTSGYIEHFKPEIEQTAQSLYRHLQQHPLVLNSLRATRVTTDAAALGVALHTGGIGVQDFVIAPAVLSMTSMLTESALGHFMTRAQDQLKKRQQSVVESLLREGLKEPLMALTLELDPTVRLGIPRQELDALNPRRT